MLTTFIADLTTVLAPYSLCCKLSDWLRRRPPPNLVFQSVSVTHVENSVTCPVTWIVFVETRDQQAATWICLNACLSWPRMNTFKHSDRGHFSLITYLVTNTTFNWRVEVIFILGTADVTVDKVYVRK